MRGLVTILLVLVLLPVWLGAGIARVVVSIAGAGWDAGDRFLDWLL